MLKDINITDRFDLSCRLVNFLRFFLRFLSAYFIVTFTVQRTLALRFSLYKEKFESKKIVWSTVFVLIVIGALINSWVPFVFRTEHHMQNNLVYCDVSKAHSNTYFKITIVYIFLTMLLPIILIFVCNSVIIFYIIKSGKKRARLSNANIVCNQHSIRSARSVKLSKSSVERYSQKRANSNG